MLNNKNFYPTPEHLIAKMVAKIEGHPHKILEPSAGKGDLIEGYDKIKGRGWSGHHTSRVSAIESDPELQATLRGKGIKLVDTDFLAYTAPDQYDLIIANPPFDEGDRHLLKAIEIMYRGQIVFLLNAETIRNPHTKTRKALIRKLDELGAKVEYIKNGFTMAERKTKVEIALVYIKIDRKVEDDLFADCKDKSKKSSHRLAEKHEMSTGKTITELVAEYNETINVGTETIIAFYRNYRKVGKYLGLNAEAKKLDYSTDDLTGKMQKAINTLLEEVRVDYWRRVLDLDEVRKRLTSAKQKEFENQLTQNSHMDFTESNIRQFVLNIIGGYEQTLIEAVLDMFDMFTIRHAWNSNNVHEKNIHYFNGWATNNAFKVSKKVVIPIYGSYGGAFWDASWGRWKLNYDAGRQLDDFDKVCNYFDGLEHYTPISTAINRAFGDDRYAGGRMQSQGSVQTSGIESTYFKITVHKKNTIHLTFKNDDILRRFNVVACRGKGWLPQDYGVKPFKELPPAERAVVEAFEGETSYRKNHTKLLFAASASALKLEHKVAA